MENIFKETRKKMNMTQQEMANYLGMSRRTYQNYENDSNITNRRKHEMLKNKMKSMLVDENIGILSISQIKEKAVPICKEYGLEYCYLFGSYAKNKATERSDVDLLVSGDASGLRFYGLVETFRKSLGKNVDVLDINQLENNKSLINEILKDGIKLYG